jgi:hypothetical protein
MQPKEQTNEKANLQKANLQINEQPKKTWEDPAMTKLDINSGKYPDPFEETYFSNSK